MSECREHNIFKISRDSEDFKKINKLLDQYLNDIDLVVDGILEEQIFDNGLSKSIKELVKVIKTNGRKKVEL
jgi:hypothetical protein